jgi:glycine/D-amino acid oxidase-like deaminating enzyme
VVICGAGLAGLSSAYFLTHKYNFKNVTIIDALPPMSFTSSKSTECYRNYWLDRTMLDFVTDSIKYMETWTREYDNPFDMNRRGYVFLTNKKENNYSEEAKYAQSIGLGEARVHTKNLKNYRKSDPETVDPNLDGMDIIHGHELIREVFPFVSSNVVSMKHVRKCGWVNAKKLGQFLINRVTEVTIAHTPPFYGSASSCAYK